MLEIRGGDDKESHGVRAADFRRMFIRRKRYAFIQDSKPRVVVNTSLNARHVACFAPQSPSPVGKPLDLIPCTVLSLWVADADDSDLAVDRVRLVRRQPHDDRLVHGADKNLAAEMRVAHAIRHAGNCRVQVELAAVVGGRRMAGKMNGQLAQRLVLHLVGRLAEHRLAEQLFGLDVFSGQYQPPDIGQGLGAA